MNMKPIEKHLKIGPAEFSMHTSGAWKEVALGITAHAWLDTTCIKESLPNGKTIELDCYQLIASAHLMLLWVRFEVVVMI